MKIHSPLASGNGAYVVHRLLESGIPGYHVCPYNPWWTVFPPALRFLCGSNAADIIHTTPDYALFSTRRNTPLVITFHNYVLDSFMARYSNFFQRAHYQTDLMWFTRMSVHRATVITAVSRFTADLVSRELRLGDRVRVIYNGIDETRFVPRPHADRQIRVLFSGNLSARKGATLLPEIARRLSPGIELMYTTGLRSGKRLPEHPALNCVGSIPYRSMPDLYNQADILLFPTVREGFGLAAAEAMACGLPVVASNCSSLPELVDNGKGGYLCPPGEADCFAKSINELADSAAQRRDMGEYNRAKVERLFTLQRMITSYAELFEEILDSR